MSYVVREMIKDYIRKEKKKEMKNKEYITPDEIIKPYRSIFTKIIDSNLFLKIWAILFIIALLSIKYF